MREVKGGFDSGAHDVKGHLLRSVQMRRLKISANWEMEIYEFDEINQKSKVIANIIGLAISFGHEEERRNKVQRGEGRGQEVAT